MGGGRVNIINLPPPPIPIIIYMINVGCQLSGN